MSNTLALDGLQTEEQAEKTARRAPPPLWFKKEDSWAIVIGLGLVLLGGDEDVRVVVAVALVRVGRFGVGPGILGPVVGGR